jgi:predicted metal-dependent peptidase
MYYNPDFIKELKTEEVRGVYAHELLHIALEGKKRKRQRNKQQWNIAQDIVINYILWKDNVKLPENGYIPDHSGGIKLEQMGIEIDDIGEHSFETVYDLIDDVDEDDDGGFDTHIYDGDDDDEGSPSPGQEVQVEEKDWEKIRSKAIQHAQNKGEEPGGIEDYVKRAGESEIDYKTLIQRTLSEMIPQDFTYTRPHKSSHTLGYYRPNIKKDNGSVNVVVAIDTSGSISKQELQQFLAELTEIISLYPIIDMTIIQHDADVQDVETYSNPSKREFNDLDVQGRGGTNHIPVFEYLQEDFKERADAVICYTDGGTRVPKQEPEYPVIWVVTNSRVGKETLRFGKIARAIV